MTYIEAKAISYDLPISSVWMSESCEQMVIAIYQDFVHVIYSLIHDGDK